MPPWLPEPGYGDFTENPRLTVAQIRMLADWVKSGEPEGDPISAPAPPQFAAGWEHGQPDLIVEAKDAITIPAEGPDVFWNFVLSPDLKQARYISGIEVRPGNLRVTHHANLIVDPSRSARQEETKRGAGFPGMDIDVKGSVFDLTGHFLFWKPGSPFWAEPPGYAWRLAPGADLILNTHLQPDGKVEHVKPSVGLYFSKTPATHHPLVIELDADRALDIPPGDADFVVTDSLRLPMDVDLLAVYPHAHYLGKLLEAWAILPGSGGQPKWLIRIPSWNPNWQGVYRYRQPVFLPAGTVIRMRYHFDNSAANPRNPNNPPKLVRAGNNATDEMAHLWLQVSPRGPGDQRRALAEAVLRHRVEEYPDDPKANLLLGAMMLSRLDAAGAVSSLSRSVTLDESNPEAHNELGAALLTLGHSREAQAQFQLAVKLRPDYVNARYNLAQTLIKAGELSAAVEELRQVLTTIPDDPLAQSNLAAALWMRARAENGSGQWSASDADFNEALRVDPHNAQMHEEYGTALAGQGNFEEAVKQFDEAIAADPRLEEARAARAAALEHRRTE